MVVFSTIRTAGSATVRHETVAAQNGVCMSGEEGRSFLQAVAGRNSRNRASALQAVKRGGHNGRTMGREKSGTIT
jgi:hypothetical protein